MKTLRVAICIVMIVGVLAMSLSIYAVDPTPTPTVDPGLVFDPLMELNYMAAMRIIYMCMQSWGIDIEYHGYREFGDEISGLILTWVLEFLDTLPSQYEISTWIAPWQASYDYWGNARFNDSALDDIRQFVEWLTAKFGLTDNSTIIINPEYTVGGYTLYQFNTYYPCTWEDGTEYQGFMAIELERTSGVSPYGYYCWSYPDNTQAQGFRHGFTILMPEASALNVLRNGMNQNGETDQWDGGISYTATYWQINSNGIYVPSRAVTYGTDWRYSSEHGYMIISSGREYDAVSISAIREFNDNLTITQEGNTKIVCATIETPVVNVDYQPGDSITIIDNNPEYGVVQFPESVAVNNLPAIITHPSIPDIGNDTENPGFSVPWQAINGLIQYVAAPTGAIMALVNEAPIEGVIMLYALIGGIIIFGMIRIMREH